MIKAIIFDWAGVLSDSTYAAWLRRHVPDPSRREYLRKLADNLDRGDISAAQFTDELAAATGLPAASIREQRIATYQPRQSMFDLVTRLRRTYKAAVLSNFTHEWLEPIFDKYDLWRYFDAVIISSRERVIKPEPEIYLRTLRRLEIEPDEAIFIDDREENVIAASALKIDGILFTGEAELERALRARGIQF